MFGIYRTLLALMVIALHVGGVPMVGGYAVFGFYILSGYLMTMIMHDSYGYTASGTLKYALNRLLRIYPIYWASIIVSLLVIYLVGAQQAQDFQKDMFIPTDLTDIIKNIFLIFPTTDTSRLTPPAWALTVELFFYVLIGLGISRTKLYVLIWLALSILFHIFANIYGSDHYYSIYAASLPFATGALIYHFKRNILNLLASNTNKHGALLISLIIFMLFNDYMAIHLSHQSGLYAINESNLFVFYTNYILCALLVILLASTQMKYPVSTQTDQWIGSLSYPLYLIHYQVAIVVSFLMDKLGFAHQSPSLTLFFIALPFIIFFSWLMAKFIELPIENLRRKIKRIA